MLAPFHFHDRPCVIEIRELTSEDERREAVPLLRQLWTDTEPSDVLEWTAEDEYRLFGGFVEDELVGVAGVLVGHLLHRVTSGFTIPSWIDPAGEKDTGPRFYIS
ncbi:MAG: hypothetical protein ABEH78_04910 [Haloferacaceae archaeon]